MYNVKIRLGTDDNFVEVNGLEIKCQSLAFYADKDKGRRIYIELPASEVDIEASDVIVAQAEVV